MTVLPSLTALQQLTSCAPTMRRVSACSGDAMRRVGGEVSVSQQRQQQQTQQQQQRGVGQLS